MSPVFIFLVVLGGVLLWFLLSGIFKIIGFIANTLFNNARNSMFNDEEKEEKNEEK